MSRDTRKFIVLLDGTIVGEDLTADDFDMVIKDLLYHGYDIDQIRVCVETSFRLAPARYEVD